MTQWHEIDWPSAASLDEDLVRVMENLTDASQRMFKAAAWLESRRDRVSDNVAVARLDVAVAEFRDGAASIQAGTTALGPFVGTNRKLGIRSFGLD